MNSSQRHGPTGVPGGSNCTSGPAKYLAALRNARVGATQTHAGKAQPAGLRPEKSGPDPHVQQVRMAVRADTVAFGKTVAAL